jgi:hypothetical protein
MKCKKIIKRKGYDMGYFERAVISNGYFDGTVTSKDTKKVLGFHNIQHYILLIRVTLI